MSTKLLPERLPDAGEIVVLRSRRWLVESVAPSDIPGQSARVTLACADDDAQGQALEVYWDFELDRQILSDEGWKDLAGKGFDPPRHFAAFLHTLRWNCVTATDPTLFQSPFRAGIQIDAYQMEPLRKALQLPRINLFIADDTGLGKTIEAGLIAREMLLRKKAKTIVVAAPPSVLEQWKAELEERFGLIFQILDRHYLARVRREHGFSVNPWRTHSRFLVSHRLLSDEAYMGPMREWLGRFQPGSLLILDEAHHAAPASGGRYAIESKFTRAVRDVCQRFEHRLFLSATPHNGHSNSFSTLLELLDPYRFTRGVKVRGRTELGKVMVRRLKEDIRGVQGGFPKREVVREKIDGLPETAPELVLSRLLDQYRSLREQRYRSASGQAQASAGLLVIGLQQRLLSSIEAFARTLKKHRATVERIWQEEERKAPRRKVAPEENLLTGSIGSDDDRGVWSQEQREAEEDAQIEAVTAEAEAASPRDEAARASWEREKALLAEMAEVAEASRALPDAKVRHFLQWIRENLCPGLPEFGQPAPPPPPEWNHRRVILFTESREGTRRYLQDMLEQVLGPEQFDQRVAIIDGPVSGERRQAIQRRFNTDPAKEPLRILLATEAAQEGLNFQAHCTDLFHFDLPWNPGRIEQRNGRIDRKLQPADRVYCHYFVLPQRVEDHVLEVLVKKTERIKKELGSLSKVIESDIERRLLASGIRHADARQLALELEKADLDAEHKRTAAEEFEETRERQEELKAQIERCQTLLEKSRRWIGFLEGPFRDALSCSLELLGAEPLRRGEDGEGQPTWEFPALDRRAEADPSWATTLDTLRVPRKDKQKLADWRREAPIRPVVFADEGRLTEDTVHLHLEQRVAQRLLARFRAQGFIHHDLSRACLAQAADSIPRVVLLGRLSLYGQSAERLHEELIPLAARWIEPTRREGALKPYARDAEEKTLTLLEEALGRQGGTPPSGTVQQRLLETAGQDVQDLREHLEPRAEEFAATAIQKLQERGEREADSLRETLERQKKKVEAELERHVGQMTQLTLGFTDDEKRQLEANIRHWRDRLEQFERDLASEPDRIRDFYRVQASRVEPVGLVYLWPETN